MKIRLHSSVRSVLDACVCAIHPTSLHCNSSRSRFWSPLSGGRGLQASDQSRWPSTGTGSQGVFSVKDTLLPDNRDWWETKIIHIKDSVAFYSSSYGRTNINTQSGASENQSIRAISPRGLLPLMHSAISEFLFVCRRWWQKCSNITTWLLEEGHVLMMSLV